MIPDSVERKSESKCVEELIFYCFKSVSAFLEYSDYSITVVKLGMKSFFRRLWIHKEMAAEKQHFYK